MKRFISLYVIPPFAFVLIYLLSRTLRLIEKGENVKLDFDKAGRPYILSCWHGRLFYMPYYFRSTHSRWKILTSASLDGEMNARTMALFGYGVVFGSTFKNARKSLRELKRYIGDGFNAFMVADGSRGPANKMQAGAVMLSKLTGAPALPMTVSFSGYWRLNSWDRMIIPKPFSKVLVMFGEPVSAQSDCNSETLEEKRKELEKALMKLSEQADSFFEGS